MNCKSPAGLIGADREKFTFDDEGICLRFDDKNGKFRMCSTVVLKKWGLLAAGL
jgi:hypothetical protein